VRLRIDGRWTPWAAVTAGTGYTHQFKVLKLSPGREYTCDLESAAQKGGPVVARYTAAFRTPPEARTAAPVSFTVVTGLMYRDLDTPRGFRIFDAMYKDKPDFLVFTGDNVYYDNEPPRATSPAVARYHWQRMFSLPIHTRLISSLTTYWEKDDHDVLSNDSWPGMDPEWMKPLTFETGRKLFLEQVPMEGERTFRTFRWGKLLQVWLPEGRDYRSPNNDPDGPRKTILGEQQKQWLRKSVEASDAKWRVIVNPTPFVGPDRANKGDSYANKEFAAEGAEMRAWAAARKNLFVVCGDRHWQYHSVDPVSKLHEFSAGPASNEHAGGSPGEDKVYHRFHKQQGGYAHIRIEANGNAVVTLRDVEGKVAYEYRP
jgi:alkaline phosphatase D